jgi:hypothetical protein
MGFCPLQIKLEVEILDCLLILIFMILFTQMLSLIWDLLGISSLGAIIALVCDSIRERLDFGLANQGWVHLYPNSLINYLWASNSNHCPILLSTSGFSQNIPKPFRFEAFWTRVHASH